MIAVVNFIKYLKQKKTATLHKLIHKPKEEEILILWEQKHGTKQDKDIRRKWYYRPVSPHGHRCSRNNT